MADTSNRLQTADDKYIDLIKETIKTSGRTVNEININKQERGDIIQVETKSENVYLLEIIPATTKKCYVHVYRCLNRGNQCGYLGKHSVFSYDDKHRIASGRIKKDHGMNAVNVKTRSGWATSPITRITFVKFLKL